MQQEFYVTVVRPLIDVSQIITYNLGTNILFCGHLKLRYICSFLPAPLLWEKLAKPSTLKTRHAVFYPLPLQVTICTHKLTPAFSVCKMYHMAVCRQKPVGSCAVIKSHRSVCHLPNLLCAPP